MAGFLALCLLVGLSGSNISAIGLHGWYLTLNQPPLRPPLWMFLPVWIVLYPMLGIAAWEVWRMPDTILRTRQALTLWGWQMGLKALWTIVFFGLHALLPALIVGTALFATVILTIRRFNRLNIIATALMLPYCGWIGFELYLNAGFYWLNH